MATDLPFAARVYSILVFVANLLLPGDALAAGVTVITHGYGGDINGWVNGMAEIIPRHFRFPGTNFTQYTISVTYSGGSYYLSTTRTEGSDPSSTVSGEIIVKLDWSQLAGGVLNTHSTYDVAAAVSWGLAQTNLISELAGHALADFPLHLIGHSRGGSLMSEVSRLLGSDGLWVDHLTTLDPHPLNNDGFTDFPVMGEDAPVHTYVNILFHDNYWQNLSGGLLDPEGEPVSGAYIRRLTALAGGYHNEGALAPYHANVHLWYYGTIDFAVPTTDTEAWVGNSERRNWWTDYEADGVRAGFHYSLIGGGDRLSSDQPVGPGSSAIRDGYNQWWDFGAGLANNRTALKSNSGQWPNPIKFNRLDTNAVSYGQTIAAKILWQWAQPTTSTGKVLFYLDDDLNPLNSNDQLLGEATITGSGATGVNARTAALSISATNASLGYHALYAKIVANGRTRYLYAPELVNVVPVSQPPILAIALASPGEVEVVISGEAGQTVVLQRSIDLLTWTPLATNMLSSVPWVHSDGRAGTRGYYRAVLQ